MAFGYQKKTPRRRAGDFLGRLVEHGPGEASADRGEFAPEVHLGSGQELCPAWTLTKLLVPRLKMEQTQETQNRLWASGQEVDCFGGEGG